MRLLLLLDADAPTVEALCEVLEHELFLCVSASSGAEGLRILKERSPALVIVDDDLPDMNGATFLLQKASVPTIADIPVVVTTANSRLQPLSGAAAMLYKPFGIDNLLAAVRKYLPTDDEPAAA